MTTFDKAVLRSVANTLATNHETALVRYAAAKETFLLEKKAQFVADKADVVIKLRNALTKAIRTAQYPTRVEIHRVVGGDVDDMFWGGIYQGSINDAIGYPPSTTAVEAANEARALVVFLDSITDETITTNALKAVGFTRLAPVFKAAVTAAAKAAKTE